jgi:hypothetical protein
MTLEERYKRLERLEKDYPFFKVVRRVSMNLAIIANVFTNEKHVVRAFDNIEEELIVLKHVTGYKE